ncbi:MAG TPA: energy transducer TonB [Sphingobacteriaceae bacterium]
MKSSFTDRYIIQQYLEGKLDRKTSHELEKQALEDEFLADALEGFRSVKYPHQHLSLLQQQLEERIGAEHIQRTALAVTAQRLSVAAAAAVVFILAGILFWMNVSRNSRPAAGKQVDVNLADHEALPRTHKKQVVTWHTDPGATDARPAGGWLKYNKYIEQNIRYPDPGNVSGKVLLEFMVNPQGALGDFKVISGLAPAFNDEAVRLVRQGPKWEPAANGKTTRMRVSIDFSR